MDEGIYQVPKPSNEPILGYLKGSDEREKLEAKLKKLQEKELDIPIIIGGKEIRTDNTVDAIMPHDHNHVLAKYHQVDETLINQAIDSALESKEEWESYHWKNRFSVFLKAAELMATKYRDEMVAATMLGISKNIFQAEIDVVELIDFWRFNTYYGRKIYTEQPFSPKGIWNRVEYRPLEGFVFAITPFNFISIAGNLPTSPAMMGNVAIWKPASSAVYPAYFIMKILREAGLPSGVINFIPGRGSLVGDIVLKNKHLAGVHFTGSTGVFQHIWKTIGTNIANYHTYPRIVGETGGKDFVFVHSSANPDEVVTALARGAFEYQGQKCSAASRTYIPKSLWPTIKQKLEKEIQNIKMDKVEEVGALMNAVIDEKAFASITKYIDYAKEKSDIEVLQGGEYDKTKGYFIKPTLVKVSDPKDKIIQEEIFGPVLSAYVYNDEEYEKTLKICDETSPYALTGSIFAIDRTAVRKAEKILKQTAGNFYINDKPTGAVVGQQPFGGARASGTNDKAGSYTNLLRWVSMRTIKETFVPSTEVNYKYMNE